MASTVGSYAAQLPLARLLAKPVGLGLPGAYGPYAAHWFVRLGVTSDRSALRPSAGVARAEPHVAVAAPDSADPSPCQPPDVAPGTDVGHHSVQMGVRGARPNSLSSPRRVGSWRRLACRRPMRRAARQQPRPTGGFAGGPAPGAVARLRPGGAPPPFPPA